ncbi:unannotated protein [freshwater metagenome]|uniref:Unannotated protein n=1 Tax=freshwater metagenome TaxID=449393 RepID=A0A6J6F889_9ZZZZ
MAEGNGAAVYVDLAHIGTEFTLPCKNNRRECLVDFNEVDVVKRQPGLLENLLRGRNRTGEHDAGIDTSEREGMKTCTRRESKF